MNDPAVEAARRAGDASDWWNSPGGTPWDHDHAVDAIKEALKPIRRLHNRVYGYRLPKVESSRAELFCKHCEVKWPCATARLVYSEEELS